MIKAAASLILALLVVLVPPPASACMINRLPADRLESAYQQDIIIGRAIVVVQSASYIREMDRDTHPYRVTAHTVRAQSQTTLPQTTQFERGWGSAACDLGFSKPAAGDRWVVYFWRDDAGQAKVWEAFPLAIALAADPSPGWLADD